MPNAPNDERKLLTFTLQTRALGNDEDLDKRLSRWSTLEKFFREVLHGPDFTNTTIVEVDKSRLNIQ
jgi:hypothetical protein